MQIWIHRRALNYNTTAHGSGWQDKHPRQGWGGGDSIDVVYCGLMKAFDKVPHQWLIMKSYGIVMDKCNKWCAAGICSGTYIICVFVNDFPDVVDADSNINMFADDT